MECDGTNDNINGNTTVTRNRSAKYPTVRLSHLQVAVDDAHVVAVLNSSRELADHDTRLVLGVLLLGDDAVKQLTTRHQLHDLHNIDDDKEMKRR